MAHISVAWAVGSLALLTLAAYPWVIYPAILRCLPQKPVRCAPEGAGEGENFALAFSVYNEAAVMQEKLRNIAQLKCHFPALEVLVYDDGSEDQTPDMIDASGAGVRLVRGHGRRGKAHGMQILVDSTAREYVVCTDASVMLHASTFDELARLFADSTVGGVCGEASYTAHDADASARVGGAYWKLDGRIKALESRSGNVIGAHGALYAVRRELYPRYPDDLQDDFYPSMAVVFAGSRLVYSERVRGSMGSVASGREQFRRKIRIATGAFHTHLAMKPSLRSLPFVDRWKYYSHKWMRWHCGLFLAGSVLLGGLAVGSVSLWVLAASVLLAAASATVLSIARRGLVASAASLLSGLCATLIGVARARSGATAAVWNPSEKIHAGGPGLPQYGELGQALLRDATPESGESSSAARAHRPARDA